MSLIVVTEDALPSPNLWSNAHVFEGTHNLSSGMATSGSLTGWLSQIAGGMDFGDLTEEAAKVSPGSDALVVLPYFAGERTPLLDPDARGVVCGLTLSHGRGHLYRALLEATAYGSRHLLEVVKEAGGYVERAVAVGGGTKGGLWTRIVSDDAGVTRRLTEQTIGAATATPCWPASPPAWWTATPAGYEWPIPSSPTRRTGRPTTSSTPFTGISTRPPTPWPRSSPASRRAEATPRRWRRHRKEHGSSPRCRGRLRKMLA